MKKLVSILLIFFATAIYLKAQSTTREKTIFIGGELIFGVTRDPFFTSTGINFYSPQRAVLGAVLDLQVPFKKSFSIISTFGYRTHDASYGIDMPGHSPNSIDGGTYGFPSLSLGLEKGKYLGKNQKFQLFTDLSLGLNFPKVSDRLSTLASLSPNNFPMYDFSLIHFETNRAPCPYVLASVGAKRNFGKKWNVALRVNGLYSFTYWQKGTISVYFDVPASIPFRFFTIPDGTPNGVLTIRTRIMNANISLSFSRQAKIKLYASKSL